MSRFTGPVGKDFRGDREKAVSLMGYARKLVDECLGEIKTRGGQGQAHRTKRLGDGSVVHALVLANLMPPIVRTWIESPVSVPVKIEKLYAPIVFLLRPVGSTPIQTFNDYFLVLGQGETQATLQLTVSDDDPAIVSARTQVLKTLVSFPYIHIEGCHKTILAHTNEPQEVTFKNTFGSKNGEPITCDFLIENLKRYASERVPPIAVQQELVADVKAQTWNLFGKEYKRNYRTWIDWDGWVDAVIRVRAITDYIDSTFPVLTCANQAFTFLLEATSSPAAYKPAVVITSGNGDVIDISVPDGNDIFNVVVMRGEERLKKKIVGYTRTMLIAEGPNVPALRFVSFSAHSTGFCLSYTFGFSYPIRTMRFDVAYDEFDELQVTKIWDRYYSGQVGLGPYDFEYIAIERERAGVITTCMDCTDKYVAVMGNSRSSGITGLLAICVTILDAADGTWFGAIHLWDTFDKSMNPEGEKLIPSSLMFFGRYLLVFVSPPWGLVTIGEVTLDDYTNEARVLIFDTEKFAPGLMDITYETVYVKDLAKQLGLSGPLSLEFLPSPIHWKNA